MDFMTVDQAHAAGVHIPGRAGSTSSLDPNIPWPVVDFVPTSHTSDPQSIRNLIPEMTASVDNAYDKPEATRNQVPLILAWVRLIGS